MFQRGIFVTGTDTEVGKTVISCAILVALKELAYRVAAMKPVATGCSRTPDGLRNQDALAMQAVVGPGWQYDDINPYAYAPAIAPHLAAAEAQRPIDLNSIVSKYRQLAARADFTIVEGAGGWRVPLQDAFTMADIPKSLGLPVILVSGIRLGCLNHTLLTYEAILRDGCHLLGWVANVLDAGDVRAQAQVQALQCRMDVPLLGMVPWLATPVPELVASYLELIPLIAAVRGGGNGLL